MIGSEQRTVQYCTICIPKIAILSEDYPPSKEFLQKPFKTGPNLLQVGTTLVNTD
jgi:hypothetical protein